MRGPASKKELEEWADEETKHSKRVERQRTLFAMLPDCRAVDRLKEAMLNRARTLFDIGQPEAFDALLEFLPSKDVDRLLKEFFDEEC